MGDPRLVGKILGVCLRQPMVGLVCDCNAMIVEYLAGSETRKV